MEGWYRWLISMLLIIYLCPSSTVEMSFMSWLQQAYHAATVIRQMQRLALNSGQQQQQQQEGTGSSGNPTQYREQSQINYNQHMGPSPPPSSNLSNWSRRTSRCSPCQAWYLRISLLTPFQSLPPTIRRRYTCATNASSCGAAHAPLCPLSFRTMCRKFRKQRKHTKSWT